MNNEEKIKQLENEIIELKRHILELYTFMLFGIIEDTKQIVQMQEASSLTEKTKNN